MRLHFRAHDLDLIGHFIAHFIGPKRGIVASHRPQRMFSLERLTEFVRWFHALPGAVELSSRLLRQVDKASTSIVLNIAEGNGRYGPGDREGACSISRKPPS